METFTEVIRLRQVYRQYAARGLGKSKWSEANPGNHAIQTEREVKIRELLQRFGFFPVTGRRILDVGCGTGQQLGRFLAWGARPENLFGVDLLPERIEVAQGLFPQIAFQTANAESLPYANGVFHLASVSTVFSSILDPQMAANIAREITRVLAPGGAVLWYDFRRNNPFNPHVQGMTRTHIQRLFPGFRLVLQALSLLPPLARRLGPLAPRLYAPLSALPVLRTHLLGLLTKP